MPRDFYEVLGVKRGSDEAEIKRAYRQLVRECHPDRNPGDKQAEARFKEVQEAFDVLSDEKKRTLYDRFGTVGTPGSSNGGAGGFQWGGGFGEGAQIDPSQLEDFLSQAGLGGMGGLGGLGAQFGQRARQRGRRAAPREPVTHDLPVAFETAALGGAVSITVNGRALEVKIRPGVEEGQTLRLQGQGPGGADLHLKIRIKPHPYFRREGSDLLITVPITIAESVLGAKIDVPTLDGAKLAVKIPPGTSSGGRLRLKGKGINDGDLYVEIKIIAPGPLDDQSRKLIEDFAQRNPQRPRTGPPWD